VILIINHSRRPLSGGVKKGQSIFWSYQILNSIELSKIKLLEEMIARVMKTQIKTNLRNRLRTVGIPAGILIHKLTYHMSHFD
jgi:hypothetical protein